MNSLFAPSVLSPYRIARTLSNDAQATAANPGWAAKWEQRSRGRGKPNHGLGWIGGDTGSVLHPPADQKLDRVDWSADDHARVVVRDFPMDGMPPMVRGKFTERIRSGVRASKSRHQSTAPITIELVDASSGRVMETITE